MRFEINLDYRAGVLSDLLPSSVNDNCDSDQDTHTHYVQSEIPDTINVCVYRAVGKYQ